MNCLILKQFQTCFESSLSRRLIEKDLFRDRGVSSSVADPDPYVFGPPGYASGSVSHKVRIRLRITIRILPSLNKNSEKSLDFRRFVTSSWLFIFEEWCKCTSLPDPDPHLDPYVFGSLGYAYGSVTSEVLIRGSGSVPKCHGSATLVSSLPPVGCDVVCRCMTLLQTHSAHVRSSMASIPSAARKKAAAPATVAADSGPSGQVSAGGRSGRNFGRLTQKL